MTTKYDQISPLEFGQRNIRINHQTGSRVTRKQNPCLNLKNPKVTNIQKDNFFLLNRRFTYFTTAVQYDRPLRTSEVVVIIIIITLFFFFFLTLLVRDIMLLHHL